MMPLRILAIIALLVPAHVFGLSILLPVDRGVPPLQLVRHDQTVEIKDPVARTSIHQVFHNPTDRVLEANYLFPVPPGAQITDFSMMMNGQRVHGEVLEREKARAIYEDIVRRLRDPGLIEYLDANLFQVRIFPIPARGDQEIDLELTQTLLKDGGLARYQFPFGTSPGQTGMPVQIRDASLSMTLSASHPLITIYSPTHAITVTKSNGDRSASVQVKKEDLLLGRDFALYYASSDENVGLQSLCYRPDPNEPGWFLLTLSPARGADKKAADAKEENPEGKSSDKSKSKSASESTSETKDSAASEAFPEIPKDVTFVLDNSGSMSSDGKLDQAKGALVQCLGALRDVDRFNIIRFSTDVEAFSESFLPADAASRKKAQEYLKDIRPRGSTNIEGALRRVLREDDDHAKSKGRLHVVVFLTDGQPTVGETAPKALLRLIEQQNKSGLRIFTFGVGYDVNTKLLDEAADLTRAVADYVKPNEDIEQKVGTFFDKVSAPALTECEIACKGPDTFDIYPQRLPDLFRGQQFLLFGRYRKPGAAQITLKGMAGEKALRYTYETEFAAEDASNKFIEPLWGSRKIGFLLAAIQKNGETNETRDEVVALAKKYNIVTPYTSFLTVEDEAGPRPLASVDRQNLNRRMAPMPQGNFSRHLGTSVDKMGAMTMDSSAVAPLGAAPPPSASAFKAQAGQAAVEQSMAVRQLKDTALWDYTSDKAPAAGQTRSAAGREFSLANGAWTDKAISNKEAGKPELPRVKIQFGSKAYFEILTLRKDLKDVFRLGDKLIVRLEKAVLEIGAEGSTELNDNDRKLLI